MESVLDKETERMVEVVSAPGPHPEDVERRGLALMHASRDARPAELTAAAGRLAPLLAMDNAELGGMLATALGALVEHGAEPTAVAPALLERLPEVLGGARRFVAACADRVPGPGEGAAEPPVAVWVVDRHVPIGTVAAIGEEDPMAVWGFYGLTNWSLAAIAVLTREPGPLAQARTDDALREGAAALARANDAAGFLHRLLDGLDDEPLVVLCPAERRGWRMRLFGMVDNFALHTLLGDAIARDDTGGPAHGIPGKRPPAGAVRVLRGGGPQHASEPVEIAFDLHEHEALGSDGTLPGRVPRAHRVQLEGEPAGIGKVDGERVLLVAEPSEHRSFPIARTFQALGSRVEVDEVLPTDEVDRWLDRLARR